MFAIIKLGGKQYKVSPGQKIIVNKIKNFEEKDSTEEKQVINIKDVLMIQHESGEIKLGTPNVEGVSVNAEIVKNFKGDKVIIFKKRRRQNSRRKRGHRQCHTQIKITEINI